MKFYGKITLPAIVLLMAILVSFTACGKTEKMDLMSEDLSAYLSLGEYRGLEFEFDIPVVTDADVDDTIRQFVESFTTFEEYEETPDRPAEEYDYVLVDFEGILDGEPFEGGSAEDQSLALASDNGYIPWFTEAIYGARIGETVTVTGKFDDDEEYYGDLAGAEVTFSITLKDITGHFTVRTLSDEFIKEKTGFATTDEYREYLFQALDASNKAAFEDEVCRNVIPRILEKTTFYDLPEQHVEYYYETLVDKYTAYAADYGYTYEEFLEAVEATDEDIRESARDSVREDLVFFSIAQKENLSVSDEEYDEAVVEYAERQEMTIEELEKEYGVDYIRECILYDKTVLHVASLAKVTYHYVEDTEELTGQE